MGSSRQVHTISTGGPNTTYFDREEHPYTTPHYANTDPSSHPLSGCHHSPSPSLPSSTESTPITSASSNQNLLTVLIAMRSQALITYPYLVVQEQVLHTTKQRVCEAREKANRASRPVAQPLMSLDCAMREVERRLCLQEHVEACEAILRAQEMRVLFLWEQMEGLRRGVMEAVEGV